MGVRFIEGTYDGTQEGATAMVDSTSDWAFGPLFESVDHAEAFLRWLDEDPRKYADALLADEFAKFTTMWEGVTA